MVESNACIKFEQNLFQEKKVVACQRISWNFVSYLGNHGLWKAELQTGPKFKKKKKKNALRIKKVIVYQRKGETPKADTTWLLPSLWLA